MLALPTLLIAASTLTNAEPGGTSTCGIIDYAAWREAPNQSWNFEWPATESPRLTMIGAEHLRDPAHEQFARIRNAFGRTKPTVVFFEGPDRGIRKDEATTIRETGESGFVRFLASEAGARAKSLEPSPGDQLKALSAEFPPDQVLLFFTLREAARLRDREGKTDADLDQAIGSLLKKAGALVPGGLVFSDVAGLTSAAARYWLGRGWRTLPAGWFSPLADDRKTGGIFLGAINRADSNNRNRHMVEILVDAVKSGERVFVVVGRNHVPMQAPALECRLRDSR